jgi:serine/threonine protein kinase
MLFLIVLVVAGGMIVLLLFRFLFRKTRSEQGSPAVIPQARPRAAGPLPRACPSCGEALGSDSPMGLCPQCLMKCAMSNGDQEPSSAEQGKTSAYKGPTTAPPATELAPLFPQLEILELIGQGGMGAVYKARQTKLDRLVAVKILPAEWGQDPAFAGRFTREARALARLSHPNIVAVHDFGETGGLFFLIMEYVDGCNLRDLLRQGLHPQQALEVVPQVCAALQYAHEDGIVHRDIKPENILIDKRGQVKIADFGLAKLVRRTGADFTLTGTQQVMGTIDYMAPEQRTRPQEVDHRADIYALGVVLYEMLTGELPLGRFAAPSAKQAVDERFDGVVFRALERDPNQRYQHISELKTDIESLADGVYAAAGADATAAAPARGPVMAKVHSVLGGMVTLFVHRPTKPPEEVPAGARPQPAANRKATPWRQSNNTNIPVVRPARRSRRHSSWAWMIIPLAGMAFVLAVITLTRFSGAPRIVKFADSDTKNQSRRIDGQASLAFHRADPKVLGLFVSQQEDEIRNILRVADEEYLKIEQRFTRREDPFDVTDVVPAATKPTKAVKVTVLPFKQELKALEDRVYAQIGAVVYNAQPTMDKARKLLPMRSSLFPFGTEEVTIEITQTDSGYRWRFSKPGDPGRGQWFAGKQIPDDYARFWDQ